MMDVDDPDHAWFYKEIKDFTERDKQNMIAAFTPEQQVKWAEDNKRIREEVYLHDILGF